MSDEINQESGEKQVPEKPPKKQGMSLPLIIGAAVGVLVIVVLGVVLGVVVASKYFAPPASEANEEGGKKKTEKRAARDDFYDEDEESSYLSKLDDVLLIETGRLTTNPRGGSSVFVVLDLHIEFKKMDQGNKALKDIADKSGVVNMEHIILKKMMSRIRSSINQLIAGMTEAEIHEKRTELPELIRTQLRPVFRDYELMLGRVMITEFIMQS